MKRILIIHTVYIGDIILATPLIPAIKNEFPACLIDLITIPASKNLLECENDLNQLIIFDKKGEHKGYRGLKKIIALKKDNNYDACICPHRSLRSAIIAKYSNANIRVGFHNSAWNKGFTNVVKYDQSLHETQRNLLLLKEIGVKSTLTRPVIKENEKDRDIVDSLIKEHQIENMEIFAIAPGSVWPTKRWGKVRYIQLIEKILKKGYSPILIGGEKDVPLCNEIRSECTGTKSFSGKFTLRQTKYFLTKCKGIVSNDSAPLHLGLAANIPVFSVFGPTISEFGFAPIESNSYIVENNNLNCRPCGIHGSYKCPTKTFDCMDKIESEKVFQQIVHQMN